MSKLDQIAEFFQKRVERYGAPYYTFALFGLISYPAAFAFEYYSEDLSKDSFYIRLVATILCFGLLMKNFWPKSLKKFLPLYWYSTVTISVPILATFLLLCNSGSLFWIMNYVLAELILILVLDWMMFLVSFGFGIVSGVALYAATYQSLNWHANTSHTFLAIYMYVLVYLIATLFARNKEMYNAKIIRIKDQLNKDLEDLVMNRTNKIEKALNSKNHFLNNVNHEIRTPAQIITNTSSTLLKKWNTLTEEKKKEYTNQINKSSDKLFSLINEVLDLSKFESGKMLFDMKVNDLEKTTKSIIEGLELLAKEKDIKIEFYKNRHIETRSIFDKDRISQVIQNLITNSIKYTNQGGNIRVDLKQKYATLPSGITINGLCIAVRDNGIGVPKKDMKKIFEPFGQSSKHQYSRLSTGLGLSISSEIISAHNGVLWAESNKREKGSTFYCVIPYPNNRIDPKEDKSDKKMINILFVDDEEGCRVAGRMILENIGYNVKLFSSGMDLMDYLRYTDRTVDLILLDMIMPDMEGTDIIKELRKHKKYKDTPIILQTGVKYDSEFMELKKYHPLGYISKPYNKDGLKAEIEKYLKIREKEIA